LNISKDLKDPKVLKDLKVFKVFEKKREALKNQGLSFFIRFSILASLQFT